MELKKSRIDWIDEVKGWGVLWIIMAHVFQYFDAMQIPNAYICSFHAPVFWVLTGCMDYKFREKEFDAKKRTYALLVPYAIFSIFNIVLKLLVFQFMGKFSIDLVKSELTEFLITGNGTVWFLMSMWMLNMVTHLLVQRIPKNWIILLMGIVFLVGSFWIHLPLTPFMVICYRVICAVGYWCIGYVSFRFVEKWMDYGYIGIVFVLIGFCFNYPIRAHIDFFNGSFANGAYSIPASLFGSFGYILFFGWISRKQILKVFQKFFLFYGKDSLIVMLIHPFWLQIFMYPFGKRFGELRGLSSVGMAVLIYVLMVALEAPSILIMKKYFPVLIGKKRIKESGNIHE